MEWLLRACLALLAAAIAINLAVRLVESVAAALLIIVAAVGGLVVVGFVVRLCWQRRGAGRW